MILPVKKQASSSTPSNTPNLPAFLSIHRGSLCLVDLNPTRHDGQRSDAGDGKEINEDIITLFCDDVMATCHMQFWVVVTEAT